MKFGVITSGGDAPGMNACIFGLVHAAYAQDIEVTGFMGGWKGILADEYIELNLDSVSHCINDGGTILESDRSEQWHEKSARLQGFENIKKHQLDALVVIGGDGSFRGALDLTTDTGFPVFCIPASIDNDLGYTSYTIGFDTALNIALNAINSIKDTCRSHGKPCVIEVMGRHCGDLALQSGIAAGADYILVPEYPFDINEIADELKEKSQKPDRASRASVIVLAEGAAKLEIFTKQLTELTGISFRETRLGFIQRGGTPTATDRLRAIRMASAAVEEAIWTVDNINRGTKVRVNTACAIGLQGDTVIHKPLFDALEEKKHLEPDLVAMM